MRTDERAAQISVLSQRMRWVVWATAALMGVVVLAVLLMAGGVAGGSVYVILGGAELNMDWDMSLDADSRSSCCRYCGWSTAYSNSTNGAGSSLLATPESSTTAASAGCLGHRQHLEWGVDDVELALFFVGVTIIIVGHVMRLGQK